MSRARSVLTPPAAVTRRRTILAVGGAAALVFLGVLGLCLGDAPLAPGDVWSALTGSAPRAVSVVVLEWRLPRVVLGMLLGAVLALSGGLFQTATRNPLGSPDVLGFTTGAYTGVLVVVVADLPGSFARTVGALVGGLATAAVVWLVVARRGAQGFRLIVVGIGITAMINAVNVLLITKAEDRDALSAAIWGVGSLNGVEASWMLPAALVLAAGAAAVRGLAPALRAIELGDDTAAATGANPARARLLAMVVGVVLVALATAVAGPIAFVALAAPQVARRLLASGSIPFAASALTGAVLLVGSDLVAQRLLAPTILPTGIVTVCLGGVYLAWALAQEGRR